MPARWSERVSVDHRAGGRIDVVIQLPAKRTATGDMRQIEGQARLIEDGSDT
jgi:hypothetical protein